jgi:hypothetical protein
MMATGMSHFHVAGTRASNLICKTAPGPAWEESILPEDFILLTLIPLTVFNPTHRVGLAVGFPEMSIPV